MNTPYFINSIEIYNHKGITVAKYDYCKGIMIDDVRKIAIVTLKDTEKIEKIEIKNDNVVPFKLKKGYSNTKESIDNVCPICGNVIPKINLLCPTCGGFESWE